MQELIYDPEQQGPPPTFRPPISYFIGNPDEGDQPVADIYDLYQQSENAEQDKQAGLQPVNPTRDFVLLKEVREGEYRKAAARLHAEYIYYGKEAIKRDFVYHRLNWLRDELTRNVKGWISRNAESRIKRPKSLIELTKYRDHVIEQIRHVEQALRPHEADTEPKPNSTPPTDNKSNPSKLTAKERTLIICYEPEMVINKGEPNYKHYIVLATYSKRIAYANGSKSKAKPLIKSIQKILPCLSKKARQQAEYEINNMEANIL